MSPRHDLVLISQRPRSIDPDILSNVGNYAVLRITNQQDQYMIENASESFSHRLVEDLPSLNQGEVVLVGPFVPLPAHIRTLDRRTIHHGVTPDLKGIMNKINAQLEIISSTHWQSILKSSAMELFKERTRPKFAMAYDW